MYLKVTKEGPDRTKLVSVTYWDVLDPVQGTQTHSAYTVIQE